MTSSKDFAGASKVIPVLVLSYIIFGLRDFTLKGLALTQKTKLLAVIIILGAITNILLNIVLIPKLGIIGASFASLFSHVFVVICGMIYSVKYYDLHFPRKKLFYILMACISVYVISTLLVSPIFLINLLIKLIMLFGYGLFLYFSGIIEYSEKKYIKEKLVNMRF